MEDSICTSKSCSGVTGAWPYWPVPVTLPLPPPLPSAPPSTPPLVIIGAGGLGREVYRMIEKTELDMHNEWYSNERCECVKWTFYNSTKTFGEILGFVDTSPPGTEIMKTSKGKPVPILGNDDWLMDKDYYYIIAIGDPFVRKKIYDKLKPTKNRIYNYCQFGAYKGGNLSIGEGTIICPGAVITDNVKIGVCGIINVNCSIGHDVEIGDFVSVHPLCSISGHMTIEDLCEIGNGSSSIPFVKIGKGSLIGAGSVMTREVPENSVAYGVPCKKHRELKK